MATRTEGKKQDTAPIIPVLLLNELRNRKYKRMVQTVTYMPPFIFQVVICGIIPDFFSSGGVINQVKE